MRRYEAIYLADWVKFVAFGGGISDGHLSSAAYDFKPESNGAMTATEKPSHLNAESGPATWEFSPGTWHGKRADTPRGPGRPRKDDEPQATDE